MNARVVSEYFEGRYQPHAHGSGDRAEGTRLWRIFGAPWFAAESAAQDWRLREYDKGELASESQSWNLRCAVWPIRALEVVIDEVGNSTARSTVEQALLAWALGAASRVSGESPQDATFDYPAHEELVEEPVEEHVEKPWWRFW